MTVLDSLKRRFARPPEPVRAAVAGSGDPDERVLAWGTLTSEEGWLIATSRGLRAVESHGQGSGVGLLPWHEVGHAAWSSTGSAATCSRWIISIW